MRPVSSGDCARGRVGLDRAHGPEAAAVVGLALNLARPQDEVWDFKAPFEHEGDQLIRKTWRWVKSNW